MRTSCAGEGKPRLASQTDFLKLLYKLLATTALSANLREKGVPTSVYRCQLS